LIEAANGYANILGSDNGPIGLSIQANFSSNGKRFKKRQMMRIFKSPKSLNSGDEKFVLPMVYKVKMVHSWPLC